MRILTYRCNDCGDIFEVTLETGQSDDDPPCPYCDRILQWQPSSFSIGTNRGKAVDVTQQILEQDYGLTNFKETPREGDVSALGPAPSTAASRADDDKVTKEIMEIREGLEAQGAVFQNPELQRAAAGMFGGGPGPSSPLNVQSLLAGARLHKDPQAVDPVAALHKLGKDRKLPSGFRVVARARGVS